MAIVSYRPMTLKLNPGYISDADPEIPRWDGGGGGGVAISELSASFSGLRSLYNKKYILSKILGHPTPALPCPNQPMMLIAVSTGRPSVNPRLLRPIEAWIIVGISTGQGPE